MIQDLINYTVGRIENINLIHIFSYTLQRTLTFPAFLTSFSDIRTSSWSNNVIYGKMDPIYTYKNTTRKISISFDVPCSSNEEAEHNDILLREDMRRSIYPIYTQRNIEERYTLSTPPFHRIRFCNLIKSNRPYSQKINDSIKINDGVLGWIEGYVFTPKVDNGFFISEDEKILAKMYSVSLTLNVIHEHFLGFKKHQGNIIVSRDEDNKRYSKEFIDRTNSTQGFIEPPPEPPAPSSPATLNPEPKVPSSTTSPVIDDDRMMNDRLNRFL